MVKEQHKNFKNSIPELHRIKDRDSFLLSINRRPYVSLSAFEYPKNTALNKSIQVIEFISYLHSILDFTNNSIYNKSVNKVELTKHTKSI